MVMHPLDSLNPVFPGCWINSAIVSKEAAKAETAGSVTRQQPATVNADGKVMIAIGWFFRHGDMALRGCMTAAGISRAGSLALSVKTGLKLSTARQT
ncbi:TP901 family phage tail tape measure protein [Escherichia coli]|nr:TP901 family phage tail tape measure protein [Escherichia coli]